jgi:Domain of unknown function (DUF4386)
LVLIVEPGLLSRGVLWAQKGSPMTENREATSHTWKGLYRAGGIAPLIALLLYLAEFGVIITGSLSGAPFPATTEDWFALLQRSTFLGLVYLNAPDIVSIALLGVMFLALYVALRSVRPSAMLIAAYFAFLGIAVFVIPRVAMLSVVALSEGYAAATSDAIRSQLLAAGEALGSLGTATPQTAGFLFVAVATMVISAVMLQSDLFGRTTAYAGIAAGILTVALNISGVIAPAAAGPLLGLAGLLWATWWILIAVGLLRLARSPSEVRT